RPRTTAQAGQHQGVLADGDRIGRGDHLALVPRLLEHRDDVLDERILRPSFAEEIPAELVELRGAIAGSVARQARDTEKRVWYDRRVDGARRRFGWRLWIVAIEKQMKAAADDHRLLRVDVRLGQCLADGAQHEAFAFEGAFRGDAF